MSDKKEQNESASSAPPVDTALPEEMAILDDRRFDRKMDELIEESEDMRMRRMKQHRMRGFMTMNVAILSVLVGVGAFGWFFLMEANIVLALLSVILSIIPPILLNIWAGMPVKSYVKEHKTVFMPKLAKAIGGLDFYSDRGVSSKILEKLVVLPRYKIYDSEDCFMGTYKGVKVLFSEARLYSYHRRNGPDFDGIFVLLEAQSEVFEGHTIITADHKLVKERSKTMWKKLQKVFISVDNPDWDKFQVFSTKPEVAELLVGEKLLKELAEASAIFDNAPLTTVLFGKKYVFMMIPYSEDMFEASNMFVPITTKQHAMQCRKEIHQILEVIDVFDLYRDIDSH